MKRTFNAYTGKQTLEYIPSSEIWILHVSNKYYFEIRKGCRNRKRKILSICRIDRKNHRIQKQEIAEAMRIEYLLPSIEMYLQKIKNGDFIFW